MKLPVLPGDEILLIVPYGIETTICDEFAIDNAAFNCTLWN